MDESATIRKKIGPALYSARWEQVPESEILTEQQRIVERLDTLSTHVRELEENQKNIISECDALKQALISKNYN